MLSDELVNVALMISHKVRGSRFKFVGIENASRAPKLCGAICCEPISPEQWVDTYALYIVGPHFTTDWLSRTLGSMTTKPFFGGCTVLIFTGVIGMKSPIIAEEESET